MADDVWLSISTALVTGLLGSIHCVGMCGPLVAGTCGLAKLKSNTFSAIVYLIGKLVSYSLIGLLVGFIGSWIVSQNWIKHFSAYFSIFIGTAMIAVIVYFWIFPATAQTLKVTSIFNHLLRNSVSNGKKNKTIFLTVFAVGFFTALLPCGLLYAMILSAATEETAFASLLVMFSFGLGTSPALFLVGSVFGKIPFFVKKYASKLGEIILLISGLVMIYRGVNGLLSKKGHLQCCELIQWAYQLICG
ncbi:MAG: sulfite exporter TauE/SafE family protein [bacterium]|nr:sulfite exporter TauE/SafE family protein [bacterium]